MIADTSFLIDLMRRKETALEKLKTIERNNESQYSTSPSVFELAVGIYLSKIPEKEKEKVNSVLQRFSVLNLGLGEAVIGGSILGELYSRGMPIDPIDAQIAGIARCIKQPIVTRDTEHFERIPNLKVETY